MALQRRLSGTSSHVFITTAEYYTKAISYNIRVASLLRLLALNSSLYTANQLSAYLINVLLRIVLYSLFAKVELPYRHTSERISGTISVTGAGLFGDYFAFLCSSRRCLSMFDPPTLTFIMPL